MAISSETVKPIPAIAPPPSTAPQPTGGRIRPRLNAGDQRGRTGDPDRLADHVGEEMPSVIGEV